MQATAILRSRRLEIVPATLPHIRAELSGREALGCLLEAAVPEDWPPGESDRGALEWFRDLLSADPAAVGWASWYAIAAPDGRRELVASGGFVGPPLDGTALVGYSTSAAWRGRGFATELVEALCSWALADPSVRFLRARTEIGNTASRRVLERCGFVEEVPAEEGVLDFVRARRPGT